MTPRMLIRLPLPALLAAILCAASLGAQPAIRTAARSHPAAEQVRPEQSLAAPRLGRVFDSASNSFATLQGVPGAASWRGSQTLPGEFEALEIFPGTDLALGLLSASRRPVLLSLSGDGPALLEGDPLPESISRFALSPRGSAVAFLLHAGSEARVFLRDGSSLRPAASVDLSAVAGEIVALAVDDAGDHLYLASWDGLRGALYFARSSARAELAGETGEVSSIAFLPSSTTALLADISRNAVLLLADGDPLPTLTPLAAEPDGIVSPSALRAAGAQRVAVAMRTENRIALIDLASREVSFVECPLPPSGLAGLGGDSIFFVGRSGSGAAWFLDLSAPMARLFFVPPGPDFPGESIVSAADQARQ